MQEDDTKIIQAEQEMWATVELMGHGQTAGRVSKPTEWGGLIRVDVPIEDGLYRTEFYGMAAIYAVKFVSEEIARAYAPKERNIVAYDTPIVTREQHESTIQRMESDYRELQTRFRELKRRLVKIDAPPEPADHQETQDGMPF